MILFSDAASWLDHLEKTRAAIFFFHANTLTLRREKMQKVPAK